MCGRKFGAGLKITGLILLLLLVAVPSLLAWPSLQRKDVQVKSVEPVVIERVVEVEKQVQIPSSEKSEIQNSIDKLERLLSEQEVSRRESATDNSANLTDLEALKAEIGRLEGLLEISESNLKIYRQDAADWKGKYDDLEEDYGIVYKEREDALIKAAKKSGDRITVGAEAIYDDGAWGVGANLGVKLFGPLSVTGGVGWMKGDPYTDLTYRAGLAISF